MDEAPPSPPVPLSAPEITAPAPHEVLPGNMVTISGRADPTVTVQVWDWLAPVTNTTADDAGQWSVTLHEVEAGDHMYFAEAMRQPKVRSERSNVVSVRVAPSVLPSSESSRRTAPRLKLPSTGFVRKLAGRRADTAGSQEPGETSAEVRELSRPIPEAPESEIDQAPPAVGANPLLTVETPPVEAVAALADSFESVAEPENAADDPPVRIVAIPLRRDLVAIQAETRALAHPIMPADLGMTDPVVVAGPPRYVRTERVDHPVAPHRIWTERMVGGTSTRIPTVG